MRANMARVTVEDCKKIISNHFELVVLASRRGRDIASGSPLLVEKDNDKNAVIALREIAAQKLNIDLLRENLEQDFRKVRPSDDIPEDNQIENYIEEEQGESKFDNAFEEDDSEIDDFAVALEQEEISFEDENIDVKD
jgi:DNA-directed RNA polymerase subunit omega